MINQRVINLERAKTIVENVEMSSPFINSKEIAYITYLINREYARIGFNMACKQETDTPISEEELRNMIHQPAKRETKLLIHPIFRRIPSQRKQWIIDVFTNNLIHSARLGMDAYRSFGEPGREIAEAILQIIYFHGGNYEIFPQIMEFMNGDDDKKMEIALRVREEWGLYTSSTMTKKWLLTVMTFKYARK